MCLPSHLLLFSTEFCSISMVHSQTRTKGFLQRICSRICPSSPTDNLHLHILWTNQIELWSWSSYQVVCVWSWLVLCPNGKVSCDHYICWSIDGEGLNEVICVIIHVDVIPWSVQCQHTLRKYTYILPSKKWRTRHLPITAIPCMHDTHYNTGISYRILQEWYGIQLSLDPWASIRDLYRLLFVWLLWRYSHGSSLSNWGWILVARCYLNSLKSVKDV